MSPITGGEYIIEYWDDSDMLQVFRGICTCEQPLENGCFLFEVDGEEMEVRANEIVREITRELA
jgi:hypothetical protein